MSPHGLNELAPELVIAIAEHLWLGDLSRFAQVNRRLYKILDSTLYREDAKEYNQYAIFWAAEHDAATVAARAIQAGTPANPANLYPSQLQPLGLPQPFPKRDMNRALDDRTRLRRPLVNAAAAGHRKTVAVLLPKTVVGREVADVEPLKAAAGHGWDTVVEDLLEHESARMAKNFPLLYRAAFSMAACSGQRSVLEKMLQISEGMKLMEEDADSFKTAAMQAAMYGHDNVWDLLAPLQHGKLTDVGDLGELHHDSDAAPNRGSGSRCLLELLTKLFAEGFRIDEEAIWSNLCREACRRNSVALAELLLRKAPNIMLVYQTLLIHSGAGHPEIARMLLTYNSRPPACHIAFEHAIQTDCIDVAEMLHPGVENFASWLDMEGEELLVEVCSTGRLNAVKLLLSLGADPKMAKEVETGFTTLQALMQSDRETERCEIAKLLIQKGVDIHGQRPSQEPPSFNQTPLFMACEHGLSSVARVLLEAGANVAGEGPGGYTILHIAAKNCLDVALIEELIRKGADVTARSYGESTPLHELCICKDMERDERVKHDTRYEVANVLLAHGADPNAKNMNSRTPLHHAASSTLSDDPEDANVILALLEHGVDIDQKTSRSQAPLWLACSRLNYHAAALLLEQGADADAGSLWGFPDGYDEEIVEYKRSDYYMHALVKLLLQWGANREMMACMLPTLNHMGQAYETVRLLLTHGVYPEKDETIVLRKEDAAIRTVALAKAMGMVEDKGAPSDASVTVLAWPGGVKKPQRQLLESDDEFLYY